MLCLKTKFKTMKKVFNKFLVLFALSALVFAACNKDNELSDRDRSYLDEEEEVFPLEGLDYLRSLYQGSDLTLPYINLKVVVISDIANGNIEDELVAVQEVNTLKAILIKLPAGTTFSQGDEINMGVTGAKLSDVNGELIINEIAVDSLVKIRSNVTVIPRLTTISEIKRKASKWGPILVSVQKCDVKGGLNGRYVGSVLLKDDVDSIPSRILTTASFNNKLYPGFINTVLGIIRNADHSLSINIRKESEVLASVKEDGNIDVGGAENVEDFERMTLTTYGSKTEALVTGSWSFTDAMGATTADDPKSGAKSVRLRAGMISMNFDYTGLKEISVSYGRYPATAEVNNVNPTTLDIEISTDGGANYSLLKQIVVPYDAANRIKLYTTTVPITINATVPLRFRIVNSSAALGSSKPRINIDDFVFKFLK